MHLNTIKWTKSSIASHCISIIGNTLFVEGSERPTVELADKYELRFNGPTFEQPHKDYNVLFIELNLLIQVQKDNANFHKFDDNIGKVVSCFTPCIAVKKLAGGDGSAFGTLQLVRDPKVRNFFVDTTELQQATVEGLYKMEGF